MALAPNPFMYDEIISILESVDKARDSDSRLYYWLLRRKGHTPSNMIVTHLLQGMSRGDYPSFESVVRLRRKAQEEHEHLRGSNYEIRQHKAQQVREDLNALP